MALMERIVRPHSPVDTGPSKQTPKCRDPFQTTVIKYHAPPGMVAYAAQLGALGQAGSGGGFKVQNPPKIPEPQEKTRTSSWSYAYKLYMTKKEKEISKPSKEKDGVVKDKNKAKDPQGDETGKGGEGDNKPQGESPPTPTRT